VILAAGILFRDPQGYVLLLRRSAAGDAEGTWAFPGGKQEDGEDAQRAAVRECIEETGYNPGSPGRLLSRRVSDGVDFTTFLCDVKEQFVPRLNDEHTASVWIRPVDLVAPAQPMAAPVGVAQ
jgi:8-oxo-dGTP pyrophosphatase MutT (NUDIX family)